MARPSLVDAGSAPARYRGRLPIYIHCLLESFDAWRSKNALSPPECGESTLVERN
ncbi:hypothetical protein M3223_13825 [Paenibacillus pasadenensis]|nr:hypothetical protein [Paenibacillus pasadenensis]